MGVRIRMALLPSAPGGSENGLRVFQQDPWKDTQDQNDEGRRGGGFKRIKGRAAGQADAGHGRARHFTRAASWTGNGQADGFPHGQFRSPEAANKQ